MGWSGYQQNLCANGHLFFGGEDDGPYFDNDPIKCSCGAPTVWWNLVDTTNGSFRNGKRIDGEVKLEKLSEAEVKVCDLGCSHIIKEATYKLPDPTVGHHLDPTRIPRTSA
jgi:hypothetical protein